MLLTRALKNGVCLLIPHPAPKLWESDLRQNSIDWGRPASFLLSCVVWICQKSCKWQKKSLFLAKLSSAPQKTPVSAEVAPRSFPLGGGAAGSWWEEEICTQATMAAVTIYPPSLSFTGRMGTTTVLPHSDHPELQGTSLVSHMSGRHILCLCSGKSAPGLSGCTWDTSALLHSHIVNDLDRSS